MITLQGIDPKMIANNLTPSNPIHPGELIKDEIEIEVFRSGNWHCKWGFLRHC